MQNALKDKLAGQLQPKAGEPPPKFKTGARRTPPHKVAEAISTGKAGVHHATRELLPATVAMVPPKLSYLGNNQYGCCVTSESCAAIEAESVHVGLPEIIITDQVCIAWAQSHGWLNGANLLEVIQDMQRDGVKDSTGKLWKAGKPSTVDYTNEETLRSAINTGPVSIAIGSGDLPSGAGNESGWYALTSRGTQNDHCVGLWGYGKAEDLFKALGLPCPAACAGKTGYLLYTWSTIGFVTHAWIVGTVEEAWVRNPTVVGLSPPTPPTPPDPPTPPTPPNPPGPNDDIVITIKEPGDYVFVKKTKYDASKTKADTLDLIMKLLTPPVPPPPAKVPQEARIKAAPVAAPSYISQYRGHAALKE